MPAFLVALLCAAFASAGGRDQLLVAQLSARLGLRLSILASAAMAAMLTSGMMAAGGIWVAAMLSNGGKLMLVAFALVLAAVELAWPVEREDEPAEPTQSLFAIAAVVAARQVGDGARFLIFAVAAATGAPLLAGFGGALGSIAALALAWAAGDAIEAGISLRKLRFALALLLLIAAGYAGLAARGILG